MKILLCCIPLFLKYLIIGILPEKKKYVYERGTKVYELFQEKGEKQIQYFLL